MPAPSTTIITAAKIIDFISSHRQVTPAQISKRLSLNRANTHRMLNTLEIAGYVAKNRDKTYRLTFRLFELGNTVPHSYNLIDSAKPPMMRLEQRVGKTVTHGVLYGQEVLYIDKVDTDSKMHVDRRVGNTEPVYATSLGKSILAFLPALEKEAVIKKIIFKPLTPYTITNEDTLRQELLTVREKGFSVNQQELTLELCSLAVPVFGPGGEIISAVSISEASDRFDRTKMEEIVGHLYQTCKEIEENLKKMQ